VYHRRVPIYLVSLTVCFRVAGILFQLAVGQKKTCWAKCIYQIRYTSLRGAFVARGERTGDAFHQIQPHIPRHYGRRARSRSLHFYPAAKLKFIKINWNWNQTQLQTQSSSKSEHLIHFFPRPFFSSIFSVSTVTKLWSNLFAYFHLQVTNKSLLLPRFQRYIFLVCDSIKFMRSAWSCISGSDPKAQ